MATVIIPNFLTEKVVNGLNTYQYTITTAAVHNCKIKVDKLPQSTMTVSIVQAGSVNTTLATVTLVAEDQSDGQSSIILNVPANCAINDTISFVLTSSNPADQQLNTVKSIINVHVGGLN